MMLFKDKISAKLELGLMKMMKDVKSEINLKAKNKEEIANVVFLKKTTQWSAVTVGIVGFTTACIANSKISPLDFSDIKNITTISVAGLTGIIALLKNKELKLENEGLIIKKTNVNDFTLLEKMIIDEIYENQGIILQNKGILTENRFNTLKHYALNDPDKLNDSIQKTVEEVMDAYSDNINKGHRVYREIKNRNKP